MINQLRQVKIWMIVFLAIGACVTLVLPYAKLYKISNMGVSLVLVIAMLWAASLFSREIRRLLSARFALTAPGRRYIRAMLRMIVIFCALSVTVISSSHILEPVTYQAFVAMFGVGSACFATERMINLMNKLDRMAQPSHQSA